MSDSYRPHGPQLTRLLRPWDFPCKSTGVGCHCLLLKVYSIQCKVHSVYNIKCILFVYNIHKLKAYSSVLTIVIFLYIRLPETISQTESLCPLTNISPFSHPHLLETTVILSGAMSVFFDVWGEGACL